MSAGDRAPVAPTPLAPLLAVTFIGTLGFSIVLPFLVFLVTRLGGNALVYGALGATYSLFQLVGAPLLGRWSDSAGRRRVLLVSQLGTLGAWLLFLVALVIPADTLLTVEHAALGAFAVTVPLVLLFVARALDGLTGGNVSVANAYLADITPEAERGAGFGRLAVASNLGFVVGPALGGILGATALRELPPVLAAIVLAGIGAGLIAWRLPDVEPCTLEEPPPGEHTRKIMGQEQRDCFRVESAEEGRAWSPTVIRLLVLSFLVYLAFNFFYVGFPMRAAGDLAWSPVGLGLFFAVISLLMAGVQGLVLPWAGNRWADPALVWTGGVLLALSFAFFASDSTWILALGALALALGNGLMWPSLQALLSRAADGPRQGAVQGAAGSVAAVASILGLLLGGAAFTVLGARLFLVATVITAGVVLLSVRWVPDEA